MRLKWLDTEDTNGLLALIHIAVCVTGLVLFFKDVDPWSAVFLIGLNPLMFVIRHLRFERRSGGEPSYMG